MLAAQLQRAVHCQDLAAAARVLVGARRERGHLGGEAHAGVAADAVRELLGRRLALAAMRHPGRQQPGERSPRLSY